MPKANITQEDAAAKQVAEAEAKKTKEPVIPEVIQQALAQLQNNQVLLQQQNAELKKQLEAKESAKADLLEQEKMAKLKADSDLKKLLSKDDDKSKLNDLTNAELLSVIADAMETGVNAKLESAVQQHVKSFGEELTGLKASLDGVKNVVLQQSAISEVQQMEAKYADFNALKPQINQALSVYPGLALHDAYILVKGKMASAVPADKHTFSERSTTDLTRRGSQVDDMDDTITTRRRPTNDEKIVANRGVAGFRSALDAAIDKVMQKRNS
jgi:hypothetical protein